MGHAHRQPKTPVHYGNDWPPSACRGGFPVAASSEGSPVLSEREYAETEYAALPVKYRIFVIMLCPNIIHSCALSR
jgi:hypothetical protein